ncbi:GntR family transcriptional regulator [Chrysiogenes arsenatis]|uniref:GntR family transcriptional regulator n=1 Tax=Chrysiogenes arsenatis TaxID=309797 RepID=UPI00040447B4|nr:GntR family transcriptional regulator [Chrysiogenes arsenatis]
MDFTKPLKDRIADSIRDDIIRCILKPGERLIEPKLADKLGMSRTPIREAFRQLESEGFVRIIPRKGAVVTDITPKDVDDLYIIAAKLEGLAANLSVDYIDESDIALLYKKNDELEKLADHIIGSDYSLVNNSFHGVFINKCRNQRLIQTLQMFSRQFDRFRNLAISLTDKKDQAVKDHMQIIKAFEGRDRQLAEKLVNEHVLESGERLKRLLMRASGYTVES